MNSQAKHPASNSYSLIRIALLTAAIFISGCSPSYVIRAAYEHSGILLRRVEINNQIKDPQTPGEIRTKLSLILRARDHAKKLGLITNKNFTQYSPYDRDALAWVVVGARKDSFELKTWWFPIVGSVPYKGFFEREDAISLAQELQHNDYETSVRPTVAFSTLGWFNDPVITPMLKLSDVSIAETVFHELFHSTLWVPGAVSFNESLANFIGIKATLHFCAQPEEQCLTQAQENEQREFALAKAINRLTARLKTIYNSDLAKEEKLIQKQKIFDEELKELKQSFPNLTILKTANNAEIMQLQIYLENFEEMQRGFEGCGGDVGRFVGALRERVLEIKEVEPGTNENIFEEPRLCG